MLTDRETEALAISHNLIKLQDDECTVCYEKTNYKTSCNHTVCPECTSKTYYPLKCPYCRQIRTDIDVCGYCKKLKIILSCGHIICSTCCPRSMPNLCNRCKPFRAPDSCVQCEGRCVCKVIFCRYCSNLKTGCMCITGVKFNNG